MPRPAQLPPLGRAEKRAASKATFDRRDDRPLLTIAETATLLHKGRSTVYRMVHAGHLRTVRVGGTLRVRPKDLDDYLSKQIVS